MGPRRAHRTARTSPPALLMTVAGLAVSALVLAGCAQSGDSAKQVTAWMSQASAGAAIGQVEVDSRTIDLALAHKDSPSVLKTVCALITNDAETAIGNLPSPDTTLTDDLNTAYEDAAAAGDACYQGSGGNKALLARSAADRAKVVPLLTVAVDRIETLTGHAPSTSTTMAPDSCDDPFGGCTP